MLHGQAFVGMKLFLLCFAWPCSPFWGEKKASETRSYVKHVHIAVGLEEHQGCHVVAVGKLTFPPSSSPPCSAKGRKSVFIRRCFRNTLPGFSFLLWKGKRAVGSVAELRSCCPQEPGCCQHKLHPCAAASSAISRHRNYARQHQRLTLPTTGSSPEDYIFLGVNN